MKGKTHILQGGDKMYTFSNRTNMMTNLDFILQKDGLRLSDEDRKRLQRYKVNLDFYEGYHWEFVPDYDGRPQITENYISSFVEKFVSTELGKGFTIKMKPEIENIDNENDPLEFLNDVWDDNDKLEKSLEIGLSKSVFGESWLQIYFEGPNNRETDLILDDEFHDPFGEYENGRIRLNVIPSSEAFPTFKKRGRSRELEKFTIIYPIEDEGENGKRKHAYKQVWTKDDIKIYVKDMRNPKYTFKNKYGIIPFVQFKNYVKINSNFGKSDIEDIIPLNVEINTKKSNISEIIDYHASPITVMFGASVRTLERGANKIWGNLPSDARVENLKSEGDLPSANNFITSVKRAMHEIGKIPEGVLGGDLSISNTSGVALQISLAPLLDYVATKRVLTKESLEIANKIILLIGLKEGLIKIPKGISKADYLYNEVQFPEVLPKDAVLELQEIQSEMTLGLESREGAMKRIGKSNIQQKIREIDKDRKENPELYGSANVQRFAPELEEGVERPPGRPKQNERHVDENKEGKPKKLNAGFDNGPDKKPEILS